jgi:hypothetical protein
MISRPLAVGLLAAGCLTAAAGGAYIAARQNTPVATVQPASETPAANSVAPVAQQPVAETEAVIEPAAKVEPAVKQAPEAAPIVAPEKSPAPQTPRHIAPRRPAPAVARTTPPPVQERPAVVERASERSAAPMIPPVEPPAAAPQPVQPPTPEPQPREELPAVARTESITIPAAAVIGLEVETPLTSEKARVEDRVDARVTRDVYAEGRLAIPAGSRIVGSVTLVEKGGKIKERARLGIRFHTLVLADGRQMDVRTDTIFREGQPPSGESSRKIGGAAVGGAVLGAIMGGGKGAILGGAAGAAGGTAAVMAGGRNAATIASGTVLTARLASPVTLDVERR